MTGSFPWPKPKWMLGAAALSFSFCFASVWMNLFHQWWANNVYSYGFFIPPISMYLIWAGRDRLAGIGSRPDYRRGIPLCLTSLFLLLAGVRGTILVVQELSLPLAIAGAVVITLGLPAFKAIWFPIAYLFSMVPIWENIVTSHFYLPLQAISTRIASSIMQLCAVPVLTGRTTLELPTITLEVARECSGVNYLIGVVVIGLPLAYLQLRSHLRKLILIGSAVLIAVLANGFRIGLIGILAHYKISDNLHGPGHVLQGLLITLIGYSALFLGLRILKAEAAGKKADRNEFRGNLKSRPIFWPLLFLSVLFMLAGSFVHLHAPVSIPLKPDLEAFPLGIGDWKGENAPADLFPFRPFRALKADRMIIRTYQAGFGEKVHLFVGYFERQHQERKLISYQTDPLHRVAQLKKIRLDPDSSLEVNQVIGTAPKGTVVILFWYDQGHRQIADPHRAKLQALWRALWSGSTNGSVIAVAFNLKRAAPILENPPFGEEFIGQIYPHLLRHLRNDEGFRPWRAKN